METFRSSVFVYYLITGATATKASVRGWVCRMSMSAGLRRLLPCSMKWMSRPTMRFELRGPRTRKAPRFRGAFALFRFRQFAQRSPEGDPEEPRYLITLKRCTESFPFTVMFTM